jgi:hypothetical protein
MRHSILTTAVAFVLAAPCTALAGDKTIEIQSPSWGGNTPTVGSSTGSTAPTKRVGSPTTKFKFKNTPDKVEAENALTSKGPTTTNAPSALKSQNLLNAAGSGPTTGRATIKVSPEYTRH